MLAVVLYATLFSRCLFFLIFFSININSKRNSTYLISAGSSPQPHPLSHILLYICLYWSSAYLIRVAVFLLSITIQKNSISFANSEPKFLNSDIATSAKPLLHENY
jgi:hypothetical protein